MPSRGEYQQKPVSAAQRVHLRFNLDMQCRYTVGGVGWYRKHFALPSSWRDGVTWEGLTRACARPVVKAVTPGTPAAAKGAKSRVMDNSDRSRVLMMVRDGALTQDEAIKWIEDYEAGVHDVPVPQLA